MKGNTERRNNIVLVVVINTNTSKITWDLPIWIWVMGLVGVKGWTWHVFQRLILTHTSKQVLSGWLVFQCWLCQCVRQVTVNTVKHCPGCPRLAVWPLNPRGSNGHPFLDYTALGIQHGENQNKILCPHCALFVCWFIAVFSLLELKQHDIIMQFRC